MQKLRIFATGITGLVGKKIYEILKNKYYFAPQVLQTRINILERKNLFQSIKSANVDLVLHLAAKTDVDLCEKEKNFKEKSRSWQVNVIGTENIVEACLKYKKKLIYISTDFVFDGRKKGLYCEDDLPNPLNFYGQTKLMGEKIVQKYLNRFLICRLSYPYGSDHLQRKDFVQRVRQHFERKESFYAISDQIITPTLISDIALALHCLITRELGGIYHLCGGSFLSPYNAALEIARYFRYDRNLIKKTSWQGFYKKRALRPRYLQLSNDKLAKDTGYTMKTFSEGLKLL